MSNKKFPKLQPKIHWEKWLDPFDVEDEQSALNLADEDKLFPPQGPPADMTGAEFEALLEQQESIAMRAPTNNMKMVFLPTGVIPIPEYGKPSSIFNFWTIHSNFNITARVSHAIEETPGIETWDVFTRYRGRVAIGKVFNERDVKQEMERLVFKAIKEKPHKLERI